MKLWHVVQWGNPEDGGNGDDGQCIVSAASFDEAVATAEEHFQGYDRTYMDGKCHVVHLLGEDSNPEGKPMIVIYRWINTAVNPSNMDYWYRPTTDLPWEKVSGKL